MKADRDYVAPVPNSRIVYVIVASREKFELINRPVTDHTKLPGGVLVLSKAIGDLSSADGQVIFQYWLDDGEQGVPV